MLANDVSGRHSHLLLLLGLLGVPGPGLGLAEGADGGVAMDLLVAGEAGLHRRRLLSGNKQNDLIDTSCSKTR